MKIRMRQSIAGSMAVQGGTAWDVQRGDIIEAPTDEIAEQYIAAGLATAKLTGDLPELGIVTEESLALRDRVSRRIRDAMPDECKPLPTPINYNRRGQVVTSKGW